MVEMFTDTPAKQRNRLLGFCLKKKLCQKLTDYQSGPPSKIPNPA